MADFTVPSTLSISCPLGITPFLQQELQQLGFRPQNVRPTGLDLKGTLNDCIKINFWLRTAHRVHYQIGESVKIRNADSLYAWLKQFPWEDFIPSDGYLSVTSRVDHPSIDNTQFANLMVKDAIVDRIRSVTGERPDSGPRLDQSVVFLYWDRKIARIYIDTSGESLSRRGYRTENVSAPLQESLASAIMYASSWTKEESFINPMCGGGTLAIEAVMMSLNRPPASLRHDFGFMHIPGYNEDLYLEIREEARKLTKKELNHPVVATDKDPSAISAAQKNARTAGVDHLIDFKVCELEETPIPQGDGVVVLNPPYGERLDDPVNLAPLYKRIGDFLKNHCKGKTGYVLTGNLALAKKIGLRTSQRIPLYNSTIECRLLEYEIYKGSR